MKVLQGIWNEIRRGENIDLYLTLVIAVVLSAISLIGLVPQTFIMPIILTALVLLAVSSLVSRHRVEQVLDKVNSIIAMVEGNTKAIEALSKGQVTATQIFQTRPDRPPLQERLRNAKTIDIMGTSLFSFSVTHQSELWTHRESGAKIRLLASNPENDHLQHFLAMRYLETETAENHKSQVKAALENLKRIVGESKSAGSIQVRVTDRIQCFHYIGVDTSTPEGRIEVELYLNKIPLSRNPIFVLNATTDVHWYNEFREQFEFYWKNSKDPYAS